MLAGRVAAGSIFGAELEDIPADRRFYAGGGGSVRGYAYQGIGPKDADGEPTGGLSWSRPRSSCASRHREDRHRAVHRCGTVSVNDDSRTSPTSSVGAGIGLRYLTPFGPLRVDVAVPLNRQPGDPDFGIYAGVGQAF